jgi:hypothetical protein
MTGRCYYCASGDHNSCTSEFCTCCGERNRLERLQINELEKLMRVYLAIRVARALHYEKRRMKCRRTPKQRLSGKFAAF